MIDPHWWLNLASFLGVLILAGPVWSMNKRKKRLQEIRDAEREAANDDDFRARVRKSLLNRHRQNVDDWRRRDEICLWLGYGLLLGSALLRLFVPAG